MKKSVSKFSEYFKVKKIISIMVIAIVLIGSPLLTIKYYETKGYTFREDVGIVTQYKYNRIELNSNNDVAFENEIYIYSDYVYINEVKYQTMYSQPELFEVGMMSAFYTVDLVNFYYDCN